MLSVIVPVYNVYDYLEECLDSILIQEGCDYEVILVDDGSTDGSAELCDSYAQRNSAIKVIHKPNGGLSDARNVGMANANGDYLMFVDSDDWIKEGSLKVICGKLQQTFPEVLFTRLIEAKSTFVEKDTEMGNILKDAQSHMEYVRWLMMNSQSTWPAVTKIVSKEFVVRKGLQFVPGRLHEDVDWTSRLCYNAKCVSFCDIAWYFHRMGRYGSIGNSIQGKNITDVIETAAEHYALNLQQHDEVHSIVLNRIMNSVYTSINKIHLCSDTDVNQVAQCIKDNHEIFSVAPTLKAKVFVGLMRLLSPLGMLRLLKKSRKNLQRKKQM